MKDGAGEGTGVTRLLAEDAANLTFADLPPAVIDHVRLAALDGLGCCIQGASLPWTRMVAETVIADGGRREATLIGLTGAKAPFAGAVLVNATAGHAFEMDDIHKDAITHPNSICVPVALNAAEHLGGATGEQAVAAIVAGYEVACRVGAAAGTDLLLRGFHPQGTMGSLAAAVTAGRMMGLSADKMLHAIGIAGSLGAGLMAAQEGAMVKRLHSGRAAEAGVRAAQLAARGFTGIEDLVEAEYGGFLAAFAGTANLDRVAQGLTGGPDRQWEILNTGYKPHATVTSIHAALDALKAIMTDNGLRAADVARITAHVSKPTHVHCAWPYAAQSITAAQMNLYYGLAMIAMDGEAFTAQFTEDRIKDEAVMAFIDRIGAEVDPGIEREGPAARHMARIEVETIDGRRFEHTERNRRGSPENPVSAADLERKFDALAGPVVGPDKAARIKEFTASLEKQEDLRALAGLVTA